ncbi:metallophosphoesterase family protein [Mangrovivirga sp. M17]|uniref:Metallophosphoesterase family protein n=1 Tax=Mangrovivirga halotolerans TaxID=2993936 RepID=A0ABT3RP43_9BACT|nr:metallophosphoesterase family protein [Mangrovivirga halotolerans]MCX2743367.1 metallophosphoesterase family protein [Mangrovivirga halotolerans]
MATYAIGDIHGTLKPLTTIFDQGIIEKDDLVVFLGDYIDRGPDSKGVIDWLIDQNKEFNFKFLLGNHEIMMLNAMEGPKILNEWLIAGGESTLESYDIKNYQKWVEEVDNSHWKFLESCLHYYEKEKFIFVHAGLEPGKKPEEQNDFHLFWKKYEEPEKYDSSKKVICGHTSRKDGKIADFGHTICIDTFAHGGGWLTCLNVDTNEYIKANNRREIDQGQL